MYKNLIKTNRGKKRQPVKKRLLFMVAWVVCLSITQLFSSDHAMAGSQYDQIKARSINEMNNDEKIQSFLYLSAIEWCLDSAHISDDTSGGFGAWLKNESAESGNWFANTTGWDPDVPIGDYFNTKYGRDDGTIACNASNWIKNALTLWNVTGTEALCAAGFARGSTKNYNYDDTAIEECLGAPIDADFDRQEDTSSKAKTAANFRTFIQEKVYGSRTAVPMLVGAGNEQLEYLYYRGTLQQGCIKNLSKAPIETEPTEDQKNNSKIYIDAKWVNLGSSPLEVKEGYYIGDKNKNDKIYIGAESASRNYTCEDIFGRMNKAADKYIYWARQNPSLSGGDSDTFGGVDKGEGENPNSCGAQVRGIGWIMCPVMNILGTFNDAMWMIAKSMLNVNPLSNNGSVFKAWEAMRNIANVLFVLFFLIIIYSQLTGGGFTNYSVKKLLPKIMIAAILVNSSYVVMQVVVDLANILGKTIYDFLTGIYVHEPSFDGLLKSMLTLGATGIVLGATAFAIGLPVLWALLAPVLIMAALGFLVAVATLIFRQAMIPILILLSPIAFVAYLLPNTEPLFKRWRKNFASMIMLYPIAALVFGGAQLAAGVIADTGGFWNILVSYIVMVAPLFSLPFVARQGGEVLSKINGAFEKMKEKARKPVEEAWKGIRDEKIADRRKQKPDYSTDPFEKRNVFNRFKRNADNMGREIYQSTAANKLIRGERTEADRKTFENQVHRNEVKSFWRDRPKDGRGSLDRLGAAQQESETVKTESATRILAGKEFQGMRDRKEKAGLENTVATNRETTRLQKDGQFSSLRRQGATTKEESEGATKEAEIKVKTDDGSQEYTQYVEAVKGNKSAEIRLKTATDQVATKIEPSLLKVKASGASASEQLANAEAKTTKIIETAATDLDSLTEEDRAEIDPELLKAAEELDTGLREQLISNRMEQRATTQATREAKEQQAREYSDALFTDDPDDPNKIIATDLARRAAGRAGAEGISRARSAAAAEKDEFKTRNIKDEGLLMEDDHYTQPQYFDAATIGILKDGSPASIEQIRAAQENIAGTGDKNKMRKMYRYYSKMPRGEKRTELMQSLIKMGIKHGFPTNMYGSLRGKVQVDDLPDELNPGLSLDDTAQREFLKKGKFSPVGTLKSGERDMHTTAVSLDRFMNLTGEDGEPLVGPDGRKLIDYTDDEPLFFNSGGNPVIDKETGNPITKKTLVDPDTAQKYIEQIDKIPHLQAAGELKQEEIDKIDLVKEQLEIFAGKRKDLSPRAQKILEASRKEEKDEWLEQDDRAEDRGAGRPNGTVRTSSPGSTM